MYLQSCLNSLPDNDTIHYITDTGLIKRLKTTELYERAYDS